MARMRNKDPETRNQERGVNHPQIPQMTQMSSESMTANPVAEPSPILSSSRTAEGKRPSFGLTQRRRGASAGSVGRSVGGSFASTPRASARRRSRPLNPEMTSPTRAQAPRCWSLLRAGAAGIHRVCPWSSRSRIPDVARPTQSTFAAYSSCFLLSWGVAVRALMIRITGPRSACEITSSRFCNENPTVIWRSSSNPTQSACPNSR